jgi:hypothetical protein
MSINPPLTRNRIAHCRERVERVRRTHNAQHVEVSSARHIPDVWSANRKLSGFHGGISPVKSASVYLSLAGVGFPRYRLRPNSDLLYVDSEFATQVRR